MVRKQNGHFPFSLGDSTLIYGCSVPLTFLNSINLPEHFSFPLGLVGTSGFSIFHIRSRRTRAGRLKIRPGRHRRAVGFSSSGRTQLRRQGRTIIQTRTGYTKRTGGQRQRDTETRKHLLLWNLQEIYWSLPGGARWSAVLDEAHSWGFWFWSSGY